MREQGHLMCNAAVFAMLVLAGCEQLGGDAEPRLPTGAGAGDPTPVLASTEVDMLEDPDVPAPADWDGTGVLTPTTVEDRKNAPSWARNEAEVIDRDGQRFLLATGVVHGIDNPSLAQTTAENRARAVLARYLNTQRLVNAHIVGTWQDASTGAFYARAEVEVPTTFMPKNLPPPKPQ
jgi:hypothetical protein